MRKFKVVVNGETFEVEIEELAVTTPARSKADSIKTQVAVTKKSKTQAMVPKVNEVIAPLPGNVNEIKVTKGDQVYAGDVLIILEAMKMENEISAPIDGTIKEMLVKKGQVVQSGELLLLIE